MAGRDGSGGKSRWDLSEDEMIHGMQEFLENCCYSRFPSVTREEQWEKGNFQAGPWAWAIPVLGNVLGMLLSQFPSPFPRSSQKFRIQGANPHPAAWGGRFLSHSQIFPDLDIPMIHACLSFPSPGATIPTGKRAKGCSKGSSKSQEDP